MNTATKLFQMINAQFPARHTTVQKQEFLAWCKGYFGGLGLPVQERKEGGGINLLIGDLSQSQIVLSAHYDTANKHRASFYSTCENGVMPRLKQYFTCIRSALSRCKGYNPVNANDNTSGVATLLSVATKKPFGVCFLLTDGEEEGAYPARAFAKENQAVLQNKLFVALDCVGKGRDFGVIYYRHYNRKYAEDLSAFLQGDYGAKACFPKSAFPTDAEYFLKAVCISSFLLGKKGRRYFTDVHTPRDNEICTQNLEYLSDALCRYAREILA